MIHRSQFPDVPLPDQSVHGLLLDRLAELGDAPAVIDGPTGRSISFAQVGRLARRLASGLVARGLAKGEVVALVLPNVIEYPGLFLGISLAGGVASTVNPILTEEEIGTLLREGRARLAITTPELIEKVEPATARAGVETVYVLGEAATGSTPSVETLLDDEPATPPSVEPATDLVALPFSSGTSGRSKGVMLSHANVVAQVKLIDAATGFPSGVPVMVVLPFFHIYGLTVIMLLSLWKGNSQVVMQRFELEPFLQCLERYRVVWAPVVPPIVLALAKHPAVDRYDLSSVQYLMSGAAPLGAEVEAAAAARLGCRVNQGYGMTELSGASHVLPVEQAGQHPGSCGLLMPNHELRIVDPETGESVGANHRGELWIRGPMVMEGYLGRDDATAATIVEDGWLRTGDIGYVDDAGYCYVVDRLKELIKYKGYQVAPAALEAVLVSHPEITDAAVIPSPDAEAGEVPKAFVVCKRPLTAETVIDFVAERVAPYQKVRRVAFVDSIPKSASGKILRRILVEEERRAAATS
ncbi:MAG: 4-coumarate--CoA ligase family protein [Gemmatimonadales bacterium]